ncbi:MAG: hypothetical protein F6J98_01940 [Moorea sp. SIO4G2]|nr:hypothetical protein [Moorena sp. SIO4G2]
MGRFADIKKEFEAKSGVPARKKHAELVCKEGSLEGRRMCSIADWVHAIANLSKKLVEVTEEVAASVEQGQHIPDSAELIMTQPEHIAHAIAASEVKAGNYRSLSKHFHPDTSGLPPETSDKWMKFLNEIKSNVDTVFDFPYDLNSLMEEKGIDVTALQFEHVEEMVQNYVDYLENEARSEYESQVTEEELERSKKIIEKINESKEQPLGSWEQAAAKKTPSIFDI